MTTIDDLERLVGALETDMPTRKTYVTHLYDLDQKFQRLDEGQQQLQHGQERLEERMERLENKVDEGFQRIDDKFDAVFAHFKINID